MPSGRFWEVLSMLPAATAETIYMVFVSTFFACLMGFPLGVYLYIASPAGLAPRRVLYNILSRIVNLFRSFPFIILMIMLIPLTRFLVRTSIGPNAAIISLSVAAAPFAARIAAKQPFRKWMRA